MAQNMIGVMKNVLYGLEGVSEPLGRRMRMHTFLE